MRRSRSARRGLPRAQTAGVAEAPEGRCLSGAPCQRRLPPGRPSASSAAASSAACWRWPRRGSASRCHVYCDEPRPRLRRAPPCARRRLSTDRRGARSLRRRGRRRHLRVRERAGRGGAAPAERCAPVRPGPKALEVAQDRLDEKQFIAALGIPVAPFAAVDSAGRSRGARSTALGAPAHPEDAAARLRRQGPGRHRAGERRGRSVRADRRAPACSRSSSPSHCEVSVLVVRGLSGELAFYDIPVNTHEDGILRRSVVPGGRAAGAMARAPATSPAASPKRSTTSACWRSRCSMSDRDGRRAADRQRDRAARAQQRPLDHRGLRRQPVREPHPRGGRLAARLDRAPFRRRDGEPDRRGGDRLAGAGRRARRLCSTSTASARPAPAARWAMSHG